MPNEQQHLPAENTEYKIEHEKRTENDQWYEVTKVKSIAESIIGLKIREKMLNQ